MHSELEIAQNSLSIKYPKHINAALIASASMILKSFSIIYSFNKIEMNSTNDSE
jgi:hypothetical protein